MNSQKQMVMSVVSKPMLKHKWASKKRDLRESVITSKMKMREGKGVRRDSITHMKEAASNQIEAVTDATTSLGKGFKKSITTYKKEASRFARNLGELVDVEDILNSIHQAAHPEEHAKRKTSIVHTPIEWKNYTNPASEMFVETCPTIFENEGEEEEGENSNGRNEDKPSEESEKIFQKLKPEGKDEREIKQISPIISVPSKEAHHNLDDQQSIPKTRKLSTSAPFQRINLEGDKIIVSSRRLSTSSSSLPEKNLNKHETLKSSQRLSTGTLGLAQNNLEEQRFLTPNGRLSTTRFKQSDHTQNLTVSTSPVRMRRLSAPHILQIQDEGHLSTSIPLNYSQFGQMKNSEKPVLTSLNKSYVSSDGRRQSCHSGPTIQQIHSSTNRQRRSSCFLNVKSADTNSAFRCKSPVMRRKLSNVNLDISTVGNMINECA